MNPGALENCLEVMTGFGASVRERQSGQKGTSLLGKLSKQ